MSESIRSRIQNLISKGIDVQLECIDENRFLWYERGHNLNKKKEVLRSSLIVGRKKNYHGNYFFIKDSDLFIAPVELKYFRIKEQG